MSDLVALLAEVVGCGQVLSGADIPDDYAHDEALSQPAQLPDHLAFPATTAEVAGLLRVATRFGLPVTARGSGTGLSAGSRPRPGGLVVSFERMAAVLEVDTANHVAVVQPGVTLSALDDVLRDTGLAYQVHPGERGGSLGGNVATNAGGMRAVKYGVTRHQVLGVEAVLASGEVLRSGGRFVKSSSGYDLTQLVVGSEGTLALVTEATLLLHPRLPCQATVLAPFTTVEQVCTVVPDVVASGVGPVMCEYLDSLTMAAVTSSAGLDLGVAPVVREGARAYLVVGLESRTPESLDADAGVLAELLGERGALDVYLLPAGAARRLIEAREKLFWVAKAAGADDIVDVVVPRAAVPVFLERAAGIAERTGSRITGCGHAGDGNVHLSIFQPDPAVRHDVLTELFRTGLDLGGAISGEHGIGMAKKKYFQELSDPLALELLRRIKHAFDPLGILGPGTIFD